MAAWRLDKSNISLWIDDPGELGNVELIDTSSKPGEGKLLGDDSIFCLDGKPLNCMYKRELY